MISIRKSAAYCLTALAALGALSGCTLNVKSDVNRAVFNKVQCHTYSWAGNFRTDNPDRGTIANPVNESRLRAAISSHLQSLGMQLVTQDADCLVGYGIGAHNVIEGGTYPVSWGLGFGFRHGFGGWGWGADYGWDGPYVSREGIVGVDLYDAKTRDALWHASVNQDLTGVTGEQAEKKINEAVEAIFEKYPR